MGRPAQAGRPFVRYNECVGQTLDSCCGRTASCSLPRLGGMARPNGVVIVSERYWAFAGIDGSLREGRMPHPPEAFTACRSRAGSSACGRRSHRCSAGWRRARRRER